MNPRTIQHTQSHLRLHLHTTYLTIYIYIHTLTEYQVYTEYTERSRITRTHLFATELLGVKGGRTAGGEKNKRKADKKRKKKYFKNFSDVLKKHFYPSVLTSYDVILQNVYRRRKI